MMRLLWGLIAHPLRADEYVTAYHARELANANTRVELLEARIATMHVVAKDLYDKTAKEKSRPEPS